jgi:hypothetical protein
MWANEIDRFQGRIGVLNVAIDVGEYAGKHTHADAIGYLREPDCLTRDEKRLVLCGTARSVVGWRTGSP